jgi:hypothetical protein
MHGIVPLKRKRIALESPKRRALRRYREPI